MITYGSEPLRAAALIKPGEIRLVDRLKRVPKPHEVEIAVRYVGICGSDIARFDGRLPSGKPAVFGHEFSGRIDAVGVDVAGFEIGRAVTVAPLLNCRKCPFCLADRGYLCADRVRFGTDVDGALCESVRVPSDRVFPLPEGVPLEHGALAEPLAVAVHAVRQVDKVDGARVVVLGGGAIGLLIAMVAHVWGAEQILVVDINPERVDLAVQLGFIGVDNRSSDPISYVLQHTENRGADIVFEASGSPDVGPYLLPMLAKLGVIVVVGRIEEPVPLSLDALILKEARLLTSRYFSLSDFRQAVDLITKGLVAVDPLIQERMPFRRLGEEQGRVLMDAARRAVRLMVVMEGAE